MEPKRDPGDVRIVIVDDDPAVRRMLSRAIDRDTQHVVVAEAGSAEEAMQAAKDEGYVFLVDINMADDGIAVAKRIKKKCPSAKIISISGLDQRFIGEALRDPAIDGFYTKSAPLRVLFNEIDRLGS